MRRGRSPQASRGCPNCWGTRSECTTQTGSRRASLTLPERVILFWAASGTDWLHAGITGDTVTVTVVEGLVERPELGRLSLTEKERAALVGLPRMAASIE